MSFLASLFSKNLIGLDIGVSGIKAVELSKQKTPRLVAYNRIPLPPNTVTPEGEIIERETLVKALKKLFSVKGFSSRRVAISAGGNSVITKKIRVPKMSATDLEHQLYFEAEQYIPFSLNDVNLDFAILGNAPGKESGTKMDVMLVAAKKEYVSTLTAAVAGAELEVEVIDNQSFALGNAFEFNYGHQLNHVPGGAISVIVDCGAGSTKVSVVEGDKTTFSRELRQSGTGCTKMLSRALGMGFYDAEKIKITEPGNALAKPVLAEFVSVLSDEIARTIDFFSSQSANQGASIHGVYVCGGTSKTAGFIPALESKLPAPVHALNPIQNISGSGEKMNGQAIRELSYLGAVAIGLALRSTGDHR